MRRIVWPLFSTFQKKLFAERKMRRPPRSRNRCDDVVGVLGDVLGVAGEDDQVVEPSQLVAARKELEVVLREEVGCLSGLADELEERHVRAPEPGRRAALAVGPVQADRRVAARVPGVAPAVAVRVVEVVRLPGVRRHHDRLPGGAERGRPEDQRREADAAVGRRQLGGVDAARPLARRDGDRVRRRPFVLPAVRDGRAHRMSAHLVGAVRVLRLGAAGEKLEREPLRVGVDRELRRLERRVAPLVERRPRSRGRARPARSSVRGSRAGGRRTSARCRRRPRPSAASRRCRPGACAVGLPPDPLRARLRAAARSPRRSFGVSGRCGRPRAGRSPAGRA